MFLLSFKGSFLGEILSATVHFLFDLDETGKIYLFTGRSNEREEKKNTLTHCSFNEQY